MYRLRAIPKNVCVPYSQKNKIRGSKLDWTFTKTFFYYGVEERGRDGNNKERMEKKETKKEKKRKEKKRKEKKGKL